MEALNKKERNSAILRFSMLLILCVIIICVPVLLSSFLSVGQGKEIEEKYGAELTKMNNDISFVRDTFAVNIQKIKKLLESSESGDTDTESFLASLTNISDDIKIQPEGKSDWKGELNDNLKYISNCLADSFKSKKKGESSKENLQSEFADIIVELQSCTDQMNDLSNENDKKDVRRGVKKVNNQCKKALMMLENLRSKI